MRFRRRRRPVEVPPSGFAGFRFPAEVILLAVRWYQRFGLSYRDLEELLADRGIDVDHVTLYRWVQRFTPGLIDAARPCWVYTNNKPGTVRTRLHRRRVDTGASQLSLLE